MAASENTCGLPRFPLRGACHCIFESNQMVRFPLLVSALLYSGQLVVLYFCLQSFVILNYTQTCLTMSIYATKPYHTRNASKFRLSNDIVLIDETKDTVLKVLIFFHCYVSFCLIKCNPIKYC